MKEAWLGDADRVGQKMTHPLWRPGYGPAGGPDIDYQLQSYNCVNKTRHHQNRRAKRGSGGVLSELTSY